MAREAMLEAMRIGAGPQATVLLHGFLGTGRNLRSLAAAWGERSPERAFLLPDLTGHGASPALPEDAELETLAEDVLCTARAGGLTGPLDLVGHSLGGRVALVCSKLAPASVARVSLLDIGPGPLDARAGGTARVLEVLRRAPEQAPDRRAMRELLTADGLSRPIADWLVMNLEEAEGQVRWRIDREALAGLHERVNRRDLWPLLGGTRVRCLRGTRSDYVTAAEAERMESLGCPVASVDAGHFLHVDAQDAVVDWLVRP